MAPSRPPHTTNPTPPSIDIDLGVSKIKPGHRASRSNSPTSSLFSAGTVCRVTRAFPGNVLGQAPPGYQEDATGQPWGKNHPFSQMIREHGKIDSLAPLSRLIQSMKAAYYAARSVQSCADDPHSSAVNLTDTIVKLDSRIIGMRHDFEICADWLRSDLPECIADPMNQFRTVLDNYFHTYDQEHAEVEEKFLIARSNGLIALSQRPEGASYAQQLVPSSNELAEQTLQGLPKDNMLRQWLGDQTPPPAPPHLTRPSGAEIKTKGVRSGQIQE